LISSGSFLKFSEGAQILGDFFPQKKYVLFLTKKRVGQYTHWTIFVQNSSGHSAYALPTYKAITETSLG
jgi:hypothetical protein